MPFCNECGTNVREGIKFCTSCGKTITTGSTKTAGAQSPPWPIQQSQPGYSEPQAPFQSAPPPVYAPQSPVYGQYAPPPQTGEYAVIGTGNWLGALILISIPIIGFIICIIWAFGGGNLNRRNFARAYLILMVFGVVLIILFGAFIAAMVHGLFGPYMEQIREMGGGLL